jgi:hypothetical protein
VKYASLLIGMNFTRQARQAQINTDRFKYKSRIAGSVLTITIPFCNNLILSYSAFIRYLLAKGIEDEMTHKAGEIVIACSKSTGIIRLQHRCYPSPFQDL